MTHFDKCRTTEQGFSTIEMLVALPILIVGLTSAVMVTFASQSIVLDTETNGVGLELAQTNSEDAKAFSKTNFYGLSTTSTNQTVDGLTYAVARKVSDFPCLKVVESRANRSATSLSFSLVVIGKT
jgi:Tfp pilus assembly protein PilV